MIPDGQMLKDMTMMRVDMRSGRMMPAGFGYVMDTGSGEVYVQPVSTPLLDLTAYKPLPKPSFKATRRRNQRQRKHRK